MAESGRNTISTGYTREIPLGNFLSGFHGDFCQAFPDWEDTLVLQMDQAGLPLALSLAVRSPNRNRNLSLNLIATENTASVKVEFNGAIEQFSGSFEAVRYLGFIVNEEIICLSRFKNGEFESCWMTEPGSALRLINSSVNQPNGCLNFMSPRNEETLQVTSWTGRMDDMEHFRQG